MRDERNHLIQMNGMNGPLLVGACGGGIPVAMVPVVPVGAMNGSEQGAQNPIPNMGNGSGAADCKYDDKKRIGTNQNQKTYRKFPTNGAQRMPLHPVFNSKSQMRTTSAAVPISTAGIPGGAHHHPFRPHPQGCLAPYALSRYPAPLPAPPPPYATYQPSNGCLSH